MGQTNLYARNNDENMLEKKKIKYFIYERDIFAFKRARVYRNKIIQVCRLRLNDTAPITDFKLLSIVSFIS